MATEPKQDRFAYDFEVPILEVEKQIRELTERSDPEAENVAARVEALEEKRDRLLRETFENLTAYQRVRLARHPLRPRPVDYIQWLFDDFMELHGDRRFGDDPALVTGLGTLDEHRVVVVGMRKGKDTDEKLKANFGMPQPEGYRKALLKMKLAEKFGLPVVCLIDTPGAACAVDAEERGQAVAIAENIFTMSGLRVPIVIVVTGEGCSGGALGIGVGDRFAMLENAYYGVISPEGMAAILWKDGEKGAEAAETRKLTAQDMLDAGIIEAIIPEPDGGAHRDTQVTARNLEDYITETLDELKAIPVEELLEQRYQRYRRLGEFEVAEPQPGPMAQAETEPKTEAAPEPEAAAETEAGTDVEPGATEDSPDGDD